MLNKKMGLPQLLLIVSLSTALGFGKDRPEPEFRTLFSNDTTNILACQSPYNNRGEGFEICKLHASVDETVGVGIDVHMLQPGHTWVPWWKSEIYPYAEHAKWYKQRFGADITSYGKYMLSGGDIVGEFVKRCRQKGVAPFISLRMNDRHYKNYADITKEQIEKGLKDPKGVAVGKPYPPSYSTSKFYDENHQYRLNIYDVPPQGDMDTVDYLIKYRNQIRTNNIFNWAFEPVRDRKFGFIKEICENYDIDGLEMDFLRHKWLFNTKQTTKKQRVEIMTGFISRVRRLLDVTAQPGKYRWLSVRIPFRTNDYEDLGIDVKQWYDAGVDIFNLGCDFVTEQQCDLSKIHKQVPQAPLYLELSFNSSRYHPADKSKLHGRKSSDLFVLTKPQQFYTAAHLAYCRGAKGVSMFNFHYYRKTGEREGGTFVEPPFEIFNIMHNPELAATQPQWYFLTACDINGKRFSKEPIRKGYNETFTIDMAPPSEGWKTDGRLRIQVEPEWGPVICNIRFNGHILKDNPDISEPYPTTYWEGLGTSKTLRAWTLPREIMRNGLNEIQIEVPTGCSALPLILDIAIE